MTRSNLKKALVVLAACVAVLVPGPFSRAQAARFSFSDQATLETWWASASRFWEGDTGYLVKGQAFEDGVCSATFDDGVLIPVFTGKKPVSARVVGLVFVGNGTLKLRFPDRADAWAFASHLVMHAGADTALLRPIAHLETPWTTKITRGLILSADPKVERMLVDLEPTHSGILYTNGEDGVDAVYVVTEGKGSARVRTIATNLLPDRRRLLVRDGIDPVALVREDRLMYEELGAQPDDLRLFADFQTDQSLAIAAREGKTLGPMAWDRWVTCFRDGLNTLDTGYRSMAFSHGIDQNDRRHFQRLSGERFPPGPPEDPAPVPRLRLEPSTADIHVEVRPANFFSNYLKAKVTSTLTLVARGGAARQILMELPADHSIPGTWLIDRLTLDDGIPVPWVELTRGLGENGLETSQAKASQGTSAPAEATEPSVDATS